MSFLFILIGLALLVVGGEFLVRASVALSFKLKISKMVIGLTVVSFATSAPELLVSLQAALDGFSDISLGNVIGSNIANIGLVLGVTAMISPLVVDRDFYKMNWPVMMIFSIVLYFFLRSEAHISRLEGALLFFGLFVYIFFLLKHARKVKVEVEGIDDALERTSNFKMIIWLLIGGLALYFGSELLVDGAVEVAGMLGISERVISVSVIAIGTSVPELAASVVAALKQEKAISLGNLIGSNIFNIASVLGITAMIQPIFLKSHAILNVDIFWMLGIAFILIPMAFVPQKFVFSRVKGLILFVSYAIFIGMAFWE